MNFKLKIALTFCLILAATATQAETNMLIDQDNNLFIEQNNKVIDYVDNLVETHKNSNSLTSEKAKQMVSILTGLQNDLISKAESNAEYFTGEHNTCINSYDKYKCFKSKEQEKNLQKRQASLDKLKKDYQAVKYSIQEDQESIENLKKTYTNQLKQNQHRINNLEQQINIIKKVKALISQKFKTYVFSELYHNADDLQHQGAQQQLVQISQQIKEQTKQLFKEQAFQELLEKYVDGETSIDTQSIPILIQKSCDNSLLTADIYQTIKKVNQIVTGCLYKNEQLIKQLQQEIVKAQQYYDKQVQMITNQIAKNTQALNKLKELISKLQAQVDKVKNFLKKCRGRYENNDACKDEIKFAVLYIKQTQALVDKIGSIINKIISCLADGEKIYYQIPKIKQIKFRCPKGYYQTAENCIKCEKNCKECTSSTYCKKCDAGFNLINYKCYPKCGKYEQLVGYTCQCKTGYERISNGLCVPKCGSYQVRKGTGCACVSGYTMVNGYCVRQCGANSYRNPKSQKCECNDGYQISVNNYDCIPNCGPHKIRMTNSNDCVCKMNYKQIGNQCFKKCGMNEQRVGYVCECKNEFERVYGKCVPVCKKNQIRINGKCVCKPNYEQIENDKSGACHAMCQKYQFRNAENYCECYKNYDFIPATGQCLAKCGLHQVRNSYHRCVCENNFEEINGKCVKSCNEKYQYRNAQTLQCDCIAGYKSVNDVCVLIRCQEYEELVNGRCVEKCGPYSSRIDGYCMCNDGYEMIGGVCTKKCGPYQTRVEIAENKYACQCDEGYEMVNQKCVQIQYQY